MPISHKHKSVFVHIPKTGGVSIEKYLDIKKDPSILFSKGEFSLIYMGRRHALQHIPASAIRQLHPETFASYYKFSIVRNPYDRMLSEYLWSIKVKRNRIESLKNFDTVNSFGEWLDLHLNKSPDTDRNASQTYFLYEKRKLIVDDVFRFEQYTDDMEKLKRKLNVEFDATIKNNTSEYPAEKSLFLTEENKKIIYTKFKEDFINFGYSQ